MSHIPDGYAFVQGRSRQKAQELLAQAAEHDVPVEEVRAVRDGYIVPDYLLERVAAARKKASAKEAAPKRAPRKTSAKKAADEPEAAASEEKE